VLVGYYLLRKHRPDVRRPFRLPEFMKYVALVLAAFFTFIWLYGGIKFSQIGDTETYYFLGWATALAYVPLYLYRTRVEDKRDAPKADVTAAPATPGGAVP